MAAKRYSREDQQKMLKDTMQNLNAKGADFQDCWPTHPDGVMGVVNDFKKDPNFVVAQSQQQTEKNREIARHLNDPKDFDPKDFENRRES